MAALLLAVSGGLVAADRASGPGRPAPPGLPNPPPVAAPREPAVITAVVAAYRDPATVTATAAVAVPASAPSELAGMPRAGSARGVSARGVSARGVSAGQAFVVHRYADAAGHMLLLAMSDGSFGRSGADLVVPPASPGSDHGSARRSGCYHRHFYGRFFDQYGVRTRPLQDLRQIRFGHPSTAVATAGLDWVADVGGVTVVCVSAPEPVLVVGDDPGLVRAAAGSLGRLGRH